MDARFVISAFKEEQYPAPDRPEVAFAGRSNVGKSSLINALTLRRGLAKTGSTPGRTQSLNFYAVGERLYLVDLPGYGFARVPLRVKASWKAMVESYLENRKTLRAVVVIVDVRRELTSGDRELMAWLTHYGVKAIPVVTKADKLSRQKAGNRARALAAQIREFTTYPPILFSAKTKQGRDELWRAIDEVAENGVTHP
ncbi:MAG: YihA family ribosome biogenesis GTP-binding protein [Deltaproteobacteria bacterium]|nr:YihA family ribosome biogenesis GTP-binding protein [Deltaproteobacteria bacterium]MBW1950130.1 YihA family ribosome biogenesis GTP-binding protein [Deltaproteobacteria bacterium]MBW2102561.1 YihA family ribosome biogenesis GTP-binding protein [Deltaproteobacteria bacterium]MBW2348274.1 YihA family ribosome biogenesis GTP-binding protein [Deltaproteobacteria bacterium]